MYKLTNIQTGDVSKIKNIFDAMTFLNGGNYDHLKSITKSEVIYNMMTNYDRHIYCNLIALANNGGCVEHRGQQNYDITFQKNA